MRSYRNCNEPAQFKAADRLLELITEAGPAGVNDRELRKLFRVVVDEFDYKTDASGMQMLHLLEYEGSVVVYRDSPRCIRLVRARAES